MIETNTILIRLEKVINMNNYGHDELIIDLIIDIMRQSLIITQGIFSVYFIRSLMH